MTWKRTTSGELKEAVNVQLPEGTKLRLRTLAFHEAVSATEMARRFILEGLDRAEAEAESDGAADTLP